MISHIDHLVLTVVSLESTAEFYGRVLELRRYRRSSPSSAWRWSKNLSRAGALEAR